MSSPMMKRMLGFCAVCAAAGVTFCPVTAINADAPSSAAQVRARQLVFVVPAPSPVLAGVLSMPSQTWARSPVCDASSCFSSDASKANMAGGRVDLLRVTRSRPVAPAVVRRAQVRAAFDDLAGNFDVGRRRVVAALLASAARILRDAASLQRVGFVPRRVPVGGPFPDVADHVVEAVAVRRECSDRRGAFEAVVVTVLAREIRPARCWPCACRRARGRRPRHSRRRRARRVPRIPIRLRSAAPCRPSAHKRARR